MWSLETQKARLQLGLPSTAACLPETQSSRSTSLRSTGQRSSPTDVERSRPSPPPPEEYQGSCRAAQAPISPFRMTAKPLMSWSYWAMAHPISCYSAPNSLISSLFYVKSPMSPVRSWFSTPFVLVRGTLQLGVACSFPCALL